MAGQSDEEQEIMEESTSGFPPHQRPLCAGGRLVEEEHVDNIRACEEGRLVANSGHLTHARAQRYAETLPGEA